MSNFLTSRPFRFMAIVLVIALLFSTISLAQEPLIVSKISGTINFDGVPDEEAWQSVPPLKMVMHMPVFGIEPTEISVMKLAYDDQYFYVSGILNYKDPENIRAVGKKRDYATPSCDWLGILLDTYYDRQNAVSFWTNPNGLRTDGAVKNDGVDPNSDMNFSWNTFWDVKTSLNKEGWSAEFRIPFSSLRFQLREDKTLMGISIVRYCAATSEWSTFPAISPDFQWAFWKPSLLAVIEFSGLKQKKPVYFAPYISSGMEQVNELNESGTAYKMKSTPKFAVGFDAKYSLTSNLTLDLTVNTDFAQVEADDQKINLTRFSLFFPEKRIFFLEKDDVFDFSFLGGNNLFYSRRIGIFDGNPVKIYGGLRLTGRIDKWDVGILDIQTARFENNPGENFGVVRLKRKVFNPNSYVGGMFTSRLGTNGAYNLAYGVDGQFRVAGDEYLTLRWAQTFENETQNRFFNMSPSRLLINWEHRNQKGFGYDFVYSWSGNQFNPGIGFEIKDNYQLVRSILQHGWFPEGKSFIRYHKLSLTAYSLWNTLNDLHETTSGILKWNFEAKKGFSGNIAANWFVENLADTLSLGNDQASVLPGRYSFSSVSSGFITSGAHALYAELIADAGKFYDGWKLSFYANPMLNIGSGFNLGLTYYLDYVSFPSRTVNFTNHIPGMKCQLTLTTKTEFTSFIQYNTAVDKVFANFRFRYNPREGNDLYLVYDEGLNTNIAREVSALPRSAGRTILLKYTYTFRL
ncbi:MAG TPA: hypothetical protein DCR40_01100 [Prolixibacteraceae bacterium]|nr:hypothetical protein [Prolixibacteraceae bacterium]